MNTVCVCLSVCCKHSKLVNCMFVRKLKKSSGDVAESLSRLSLEESSSQTQAKTLSALESIYSFTCTQPAQFPHTHSREFTQQLQHLPTGKTSPHRSRLD